MQNGKQKPRRSSPAFRLALLDLSRLTEEIAVLSTSLIGRSASQRGYPPKVQHLLAKAFFSCLNSSVSAKFRFAVVDEVWVRCGERPPSDNLYTLRPLRIDLKEMMAQWLGTTDLGDGHSPDPKDRIEVVLKIISGLPELARGRSGAMTLIAGGTPGTFQDRIHADAATRPANYLVAKPASGANEWAPVARDLTICVQRGAPADQLADTLKPLESAARTSIKDCPILIDAMDLLTKKGANIAAMIDESDKQVRMLLKHLPHQEISGAPEGTAILAMSPNHLGIDTFIGVTRRTTTVMTAVAAKALNAVMIAVPLVPEPVGPDGRTYQYQIGGKAPIFTDDLIRGRNAFLIATGVTSHPLLEGVRFGKSPAHCRLVSRPPDAGETPAEGPEPTPELAPRAKSARNGLETNIQSVRESNAKEQSIQVHTQSIVLNAASQTVRFIDHTRDLNEDYFYAVRSGSRRELRSAIRVYEDFDEDICLSLARGESKRQNARGTRTAKKRPTADESVHLPADDT